MAMLATGVAVPAEAELPAGAAMGLGSHGECTAGLLSPAPASFFDVFVLLGFCARFPGSESAAIVAPTGCSSPVSQSSSSLETLKGKNVPTDATIGPPPPPPPSDDDEAASTIVYDSFCFQAN